MFHDGRTVAERCGDPTMTRGRPPIGDRVTVRLQPDLLARIDAEAERRDVSRAELIRDLLSASLPVAADPKNEEQP